VERDVDTQFKFGPTVGSSMGFFIPTSLPAVARIFFGEIPSASFGGDSYEPMSFFVQKHEQNTHSKAKG
jgi:hypothetical protein